MVRYVDDKSIQPNVGIVVRAFESAVLLHCLKDSNIGDSRSMHFRKGEKCKSMVLDIKRTRAGIAFVSQTNSTR